MEVLVTVSLADIACPWQVAMPCFSLSALFHLCKGRWVMEQVNPANQAED
jgi:hypothetical protein